jgi:hypothetical protein
MAAVVTNRGRPDSTRTVAFAPVHKSSAHGSVAMNGAGSAQDTNVDASVAAAPRNHNYAVWLLDREPGKMSPVGVLPPDGRGRYRLPSRVLAGYDTVDASLQTDNGDPSHSNDSVLRAGYA